MLPAMGLFDKVKAAKNFVTGGGAQLSVQIGQAVPGAPVPVMVSAQVGSAPLSVNQVYVRVRGEEIIQMTVRDRDDPGDRDRINERTETFDQTFQITGPLQLEANSQAQWQGQFQLPPNAAPSYIGRNARHVWSVMAALDIRGNDPDSGWVEFHMR
jgi:hypothetical protein